jgi:hypothetical protein
MSKELKDAQVRYANSKELAERATRIATRDLQTLEQLRATNDAAKSIVQVPANAERRTECPLCEIGTLTPRTWSGVFGNITVAGLEGHTCDKCDAEPILTDQIRRNQERIANARATGVAENQQ